MRFIAHLFAFLLFGRSRVETGFLKAEASRGGVRLDKQQALLFSLFLSFWLLSSLVIITLCRSARVMIQGFRVYVIAD